MMDATLVFQLLNTAVLLMVVIGIPMLLVKMYKNSKRKTEAIEVLSTKIDELSKKIDAM